MLRHLALLAVTGCGLTVVGVEAVDGGVEPGPSPSSTSAPTSTSTSTSTTSPTSTATTSPPEAGAPDVTCACSVTAVCEGATCVEVANTLAGFRYELACTAAGSSAQTCAQPTPVPTKTVTLGGTPGKSYDVQIHVRGEVEQRTYANPLPGNAKGTNAGFFVIAAVSGSDAWNAYALVLSDPATSYALNSGTSGHYYTDALDYTATIRVKAGATLTMQSQATDVNIIKNINQADGGANVVPGVPPDPKPFDGQFIQIDVNGVAPAP